MPHARAHAVVFRFPPTLPNVACFILIKNLHLQLFLFPKYLNNKIQTSTPPITVPSGLPSQWTNTFPHHAVQRSSNNRSPRVAHAGRDTVDGHDQGVLQPLLLLLGLELLAAQLLEHVRLQHVERVHVRVSQHHGPLQNLTMDEWMDVG